MQNSTADALGRCAEPSLAGVPTRFQDVDIIIVRENTEGLYSGVENQVTDDVVMSMKVATKSASLRIAHWAFRFATRRQRRKITVFHKANIMKVTDGLFLECARRIHQHEYRTSSTRRTSSTPAA